MSNANSHSWHPLCPSRPPLMMNQRWTPPPHIPNTRMPPPNWNNTGCQNIPPPPHVNQPPASPNQPVVSWPFPPPRIPSQCDNIRMIPPPPHFPLNTPPPPLMPTNMPSVQNFSPKFPPPPLPPIASLQNPIQLKTEPPADTSFEGFQGSAPLPFPPPTNVSPAKYVPPPSAGMFPVGYPISNMEICKNFPPPGPSSQIDATTTQYSPKQNLLSQLSNKVSNTSSIYIVGHSNDDQKPTSLYPGDATFPKYDKQPSNREDLKSTRREDKQNSNTAEAKYDSNKNCHQEKARPYRPKDSMKVSSYKSSDKSSFVSRNKLGIDEKLSGSESSSHHLRSVKEREHRISWTSYRDKHSHRSGRSRSREKQRSNSSERHDRKHTVYHLKSRSQERSSVSRERISRSRDRTSRSRERISRSRDRTSRSRERISRSRDRTSRSRERISRSRDRTSRSCNRTSRSRERISRSCERASKSQEKISRNHDRTSKSQERISKIPRNVDRISRSRDSRSRSRTSRSRERISRSRDRTSRSRERISTSRGRTSRSQERISTSRDRTSRSRERISRSRETFSRNRGTISRSYERYFRSKERVKRESKSERHSSKEKEKINIKKEKRDRSRSPHRVKSEIPEDRPSLSTKASKFVCSSSAECFYTKVEEEVVATMELKELHEKFRYELVDRAERVRASKPKYEPPQRKTKLRKPKPLKVNSDDESSSSSEKSSSEEEDTAIEELEKKRRHPDRLHLELWFNDPKEMNDGPLCRCSAKARRSGIRHGIYVGEGHLLPCNPLSNNVKRLHHYRITMTPHTNFLTKTPTTIVHNGHEYIFEGFSMFSHSPLPKLPNCKVIRFNYEYTILYIEEEMPQNFTVAGLELFMKYLLIEILELVDLNWKAHDDTDGCPRFHFMPRFAREIKGKGKELLSLCEVLKYLLNANKILIDEQKLPEILSLPTQEWQNLADEVKGMIVTCPGMKPSSIRVDQLDREQCDPYKDIFPVIVHFGVRPPQLSYAGNPHYQKAWRDYVKYRHLLANKPKVKYADRHRLMQKETRLQEMRLENDLKRDVTVVISSKGFYKTGIMSDVIQHAMLLPVLVCHLRFHQSLSNLEEKIGYKFKDRFLLQLALTHPSYRENFGTNPDHARNSLTNCGLRQPQYGDRRIHYMNTRKRGINTLINIMSRFGSQKEAISSINHNERLEFLGDAVVEFLSSIHLFYMFPDLEEGGLATYRAAIVQNQHLAVLSKKLQLEKFMLYAHGSDLCHDLELRHAMANCFEALMGALFLDDGIEVADRVFSQTLFTEPELYEVWQNYPPHPLQEQEPGGDRKWLASVPLLQKLNKFEEQIGIEFTHIRLLARALTHRSLGYNNLTLGSNQRLEFLGDTVLQLVASEYLYKYFPEHHEGHLSLLRSSLVNNRTQAVVCADLGMVEYAIYPYSKVELKPKDKADLLEAFLGALYVDKDLGYCRKFCEVCFFPRLQDFIMNQDWNDPKSKLQQCCLTLRSMDGGEPDIPTYKVIECKGPTNTRVYSVAVYFQGNRLAVGSGHSIQQAEMDAASNALKISKGLFPQLRHQRRAIERSLKQGPPAKQRSSPSPS